jgi:hypothetical protein
MAEDKSMERIINLLERQMALDLYLRGVKQDRIARIVQKSKTWVNDLLRDIARNNG